MENERLLEKLEHLNTLLEKRTNRWNIFFSGVINGIGSAIGAALIGAILVGLLASNLGKIPIIRDILPKEIEEYIGNGIGE
jgi:hypothetical protein